MTHFLREERQEFPCFGGYEYFAMDVNFDIYRCDFWATRMCSIEEFATAPLVRDGCTKCMSVCYRDSSVFFNLPVAIGDMMRHLRQGRLMAATRAMLHPSVRKSARSLLSEWHTLKKLARTN